MKSTQTFAACSLVCAFPLAQLSPSGQAVFLSNSMSKPLPQVEPLAIAFSKALLAEIGLKKVRIAHARNRRELTLGTCHSHDFCDANVVMAHAWGSFGFTEDEVCDLITSEVNDAPAPASQRSAQAVAIWNAAWTLAKINAFFTTTAGAMPIVAHKESEAA